MNNLDMLAIVQGSNSDGVTQVTHIADLLVTAYIRPQGVNVAVQVEGGNSAVSLDVPFQHYIAAIGLLIHHDPDKTHETFASLSELGFVYACAEKAMPMDRSCRWIP